MINLIISPIQQTLHIILRTSLQITHLTTVQLALNREMIHGHMKQIRRILGRLITTRQILVVDNGQTTRAIRQIQAVASGRTTILMVKVVANGLTILTQGGG